MSAPAPRRDAPCRDASGREFSGRPVSGRELSGRELSDRPVSVGETAAGDVPRRDFLRWSGSATGAVAVLGAAACRDAGREAAEAMQAGTEPVVLSPDEVRTLEAVADTILPPDGDAPGAAAMGAVVFADKYLKVNEPLAGATRAALAALAEGTGGVPFEDLDADARAEAMAAFEAHPSGLFGLVQMLVMVGSLCTPSRGGNRDEAGWALLGFRDDGVWQPPFGAYDGPEGDRA